MSATPRSTNFRFEVQGNLIDKILGDYKGDFINKRYKALN